MIGVDNVPAVPFPRGDMARKPILTPIQNRTRKAKRALAARGMTEAVTWSFVSKKEAELLGGGAGTLALANPIASELSDMRPSLIAGLVAAAQKNADRGSNDVALFEVGPDIQRRYAGGSVYRRQRRAPRAGKTGRQWPSLVERRNSRRCLRCQGRCFRRARSGRRADAGVAGRPRRPGVVSSRPQRHHPDRPAERARSFWRVASPRVGSARCRRPAGRLRSAARQNSRAESQSRHAPSRCSNYRPSSRSSGISLS